MGNPHPISFLGWLTRKFISTRDRVCCQSNHAGTSQTVQYNQNTVTARHFGPSDKAPAAPSLQTAPTLWLAPSRAVCRRNVGRQSRLNRLSRPARRAIAESEQDVPRRYVFDTGELQPFLHLSAEWPDVRDVVHELSELHDIDAPTRRRRPRSTMYVKRWCDTNAKRRQGDSIAR
jgi:hypothetical protein